MAARKPDVSSNPAPLSEMQVWLEEKGYRKCGPSSLKRGALLYQKRHHDLEADADSNAKCCVNVWEWPPMEWYEREGLNHFHYEVEMYWESDEPNSYAANLSLYTFTEEALRKQLDALEQLCVTLWNTYSKGRRK